jgi:hypothetical protein
MASDGSLHRLGERRSALLHRRDERIVEIRYPLFDPQSDATQRCQMPRAPQHVARNYQAEYERDEDIET